MKRRIVALVGTLVLSAALHAQEPGQAEAAPSPVETAVREALAAAGRGAPEEAIRILEETAAKGSLPPPALSFLGTLRLETGNAAGALEILAPLAEQIGDPAVLYHAGRAALALGRVDEAAGYFERSVAIEAVSPAARELGLLRGRQGDLEGAYVHLRAWSLARPDDVEARLAAAHSAVRLRRAREAEELLTGLPEDEPRVRLLRGELHLLQGNAAQALTTLRPLLGNSNADLDRDARRLIGDAEMLLGNAKVAVEVLQGHVDGRPDIALLLARALKQQGDIAGAVAQLAPFAEEEAGRRIPGLLLEYGRLLTSSGRANEAVRFLELATRQDPEDRPTWYALGQALAASGRAEEARQATARFQELAGDAESSEMSERRARDEMNDPAGARSREALQLLAEGKPNDALAIVEREARLAPGDPRPLMVMARTLLVLKRASEAMQAAQRAYAIAPEVADVLYQRGAVHVALGDLAAAEADFRQALARAPEHTATMTDLAVLLMVKGERDEARTLLQRVLELRPGDALALSNLERLRELSGG